MVRSQNGIELLVNLINITYCAMKILPYQDEAFAKYRTESVQEFRFALSEKIKQEVFFANFVQNIETSIKSTAVLNALKRLIQQRFNYLLSHWGRSFLDFFRVSTNIDNITTLLLCLPVFLR